MSEVILQTHPLEFQNSRQATKITYLQHEIVHLQDNVRDLEELVRINKEAMKIMSNQYSQSNNKTKSSSQEDITSSTIDHHSSPQSNKNFYALSEQLQEENARLLEMIQKLKKDRAIAQSKALLSEQVMEEVQRHEAEVVGEMEQKVLDLRKMIQDKEFFIQQLEKVKPFPDQDGVVVKFREVMSATDQNMRLHEEINNYKFMLTKMGIEINKVKSENQELINANSRLNNELVKLKTMLANPMNNNKFSLKSLFTGRRQAKLNQSLHKSPLQIPDDDLNSSKGSVNKLPCGGLTKPSKFKDAPKIPPQKSSSPRYSSNPLLDIKLLEQISQLETELDSMKRRANCEQINNGILSDELLKIKRICKDMMATNEILCKANKKNQEKWEQMSYAMEFYKAFYHKYMDLISKRKPQTRGAIMEIPNIEALKKINETLVTGLELTPVKLFTERDREESDLSNKPECSKTPRRSTKIVQTPYQFTKQQAKAFLINLSKEFYANIHPALAALENSPTIPEEREDNEVKCRTKVRRSRRSMSNALDYVCARRKLIFEPIQEEEPEEIRRAQRKGSLVAWNNAQGRGNEIGILALQANRLASIKNSEHLSFSIDMEELDKVKATETSFISTNDFIQTLD